MERKKGDENGSEREEGGGDDGTTAIWESNIFDLTAPYHRNIRNCGRVIDGQCVASRGYRGETDLFHPLGPKRGKMFFILETFNTRLQRSIVASYDFAMRPKERIRREEIE